MHLIDWVTIANGPATFSTQEADPLSFHLHDINSPWMYNLNGNITFNATYNNKTIEAINTIFNNSITTYIDSQDQLINSSIRNYSNNIIYEPSYTNLEGFWNFDNSSFINDTYILDSSYNSKNGKGINTKYTNSGYYGSGLDFNGVNTSMIIGENKDFSDATNGMTISLWAKPEGGYNIGEILLARFNETNNDRFFLFYIGGVGIPYNAYRAYFVIYEDGGIVNCQVDGGTILVDNWYNLIVTYDSYLNETALYING